MPWTTTIDGKTGEQKTFWLDASFGCRKSQTSIRCATPTHPVVEITWITSRYSAARSARKFDYTGLGRKTAEEFFNSKKNKRCRPTWTHHTTGTHEIA